MTEFLAAGIDKDDLDEELLYECLNGITTRIHKRCIIFIRSCQEEDHKTYENLDRLVRKWNLKAMEEFQDKLIHVKICANG